MNRWLRGVTLGVLVAFLGLTVVETFHGHATAQAQSACSLCIIVHQVPALTNPAALPAPVSTVSRTPFVPVAHPYLVFVFESHGLSPPAI